MSETQRNLREVADIWLHEGLKRAVEHGLHALGSNPAGYSFLEHLDGGPVVDPRLATELGDLQLDGPVGVGAGWDKLGITARGWQALGMDHITPGGVPLDPQIGLSMPRLRTFDRTVGDHGTIVSLNAFGFYSKGAIAVRDNIAEVRDSGIVIKIIGQVTVNKQYYEEGRRHEIGSQLAKAIRILLPVVDGISIGISSPNTEGMREAQDAKEYMRSSLGAAREATITSTRRVPLFTKTDGDGGHPRLETVCDVVLETETDGVELINTTAKANIKAKYGALNLPGGLAGGDREYQDMAVDSVRFVYEAIGDKTAVHGMGGVGYGEDPHEISDQAAAWQAIRLIRNGASAISENTGIRHLKHRSARSVKRGIIAELDRHPEITKLGQLVGIDTARGPKLKAAA